MHALYPHPYRRPPVRGRAFPAFIAILAVVVALLGFVGVAAQTRTTHDATAAREPVRMKAVDPSEAFVYFPSQFELQAREPATYIEPF